MHTGSQVWHTNNCCCLIPSIVSRNMKITSFSMPMHLSLLCSMFYLVAFPFVVSKMNYLAASHVFLTKFIYRRFTPASKFLRWSSCCTCYVFLYLIIYLRNNILLLFGVVFFKYFSRHINFQKLCEQQFNLKLWYISWW